MTTAAFKSTSNRGNNQSSPQRRRRSLSVSAVSRTQSLPEIPSEFSNKRDNPLFWSNEAKPGNASGSPKNGSEGAGLTSKSADADIRGRSVTRNLGVDRKKEVGRSLSKVATGRRRRSMSRGHYGASESEVGLEPVTSSNFQNGSDLNIVSNRGKRSDLVGNSAGRSVPGKYSRVLPNQNPSIEDFDDSATRFLHPNRENGTLEHSMLEAEEKTMKAIYEQMEPYHTDHMERDKAMCGIYETLRAEVRRAISGIQNDLECTMRRSNTTAIAATDVTDIPPDMVNPGDVELILDIRREYAKKLEQSQERARKLRSDLAVEEHRAQELSRILKEILPNPMTTNVQRYHPGRKNSSERNKMSKRLTEEAIAYFDECVSISTFDSSDFSASEDPHSNSVGATISVGSTTSASQESLGFSKCYSPHSCFNHEKVEVVHGQVMRNCMESGLTANSRTEKQIIGFSNIGGTNAEWGRTSPYSVSNKPIENVSLQEEIESFIKNTSNDGINSEIRKSSYFDIDEYCFVQHRESCLFDRFVLNSRIESGSMHLCGGSLGYLSSPFASVI